MCFLLKGYLLLEIKFYGLEKVSTFIKHILKNDKKVSKPSGKVSFNILNFVKTMYLNTFYSYCVQKL